MGSACCCNYEKESPQYVEIMSNLKAPTSLSNNQSSDFLLQGTHDETLDFRFQRISLLFSSKESLDDSYMLLSALGHSKYYTTYKAYHKRGGTYHAVKSVHSEFYQISGMEEEARILKSLDHPNILKLTEIIEETDYIHIVTELCTGGTLLQRVSACSYFTENQAAEYMSQLMAGVLYYQQKGFTNKSLTPDSILFLTDAADSPLKITTFSKDILDEFSAPEAIRSEKSDIFSCGAILSTLLCGSPKVNISSKSWEKLSKSGKDLIEQMMSSDPDQRPSAEFICRCKWIRKRYSSKDKRLQEEALVRLSQFNASRKLRLGMMEFMASRLMSAEETNSLSRTFKQLDVNGDGRLTIDELKAGYQNLGLQKTQIEDVLRSCDADSNGYIDYSEFVTAAANWQLLLSQEKLEAVFNTFDIDRNGQISCQELHELFGGNQELVEQFIMEMDANGDGVVDLQEFKSFMMNVNLTKV